MSHADSDVGQIEEILTPTRQAQIAKDGFAAALTRPMAWRREQLVALDNLLAENGAEIEEAVLSDLRKPQLESFLAETGSVRTEIALVLKNLDEWTSPRAVAVPDMLQPASARIIREPLGTVLVIAPWNYPVHLLLMPVVAALGAGNAVVMKPSELAPATSVVMSKLIPRYLDARAIQIVEGGIAETTELLEFKWDHIFYTGNGTVGRIVLTAAAKHLTPVTLELGGKSPVFIDNTADISAAANWLAWGKFLNAGQTCVAPDYVLATADVVEELVESLGREIEVLYGQDPRESPDFGRIVNERHLDRLLALLPSAGAVIGGDSDRADRYLAPTVLTGVDVDDAVMRDEIFGPVLPIISVSGPEDAIDLIADGEKPLAMYLFTKSSAVEEAFITRTSSGSLTINATMLQLGVDSLPFGGVGASGMGSYHGEHGIRTFSHERSVLSKGPTPAEFLAFGRAPYTVEKDQLLRGYSA